MSLKNMNMETINAKQEIIIELQYFPPISYFTLITPFNNIQIEAFEHFKKQSYRNRCLINGANKIEKLIVPVKHSMSQTNIRDIHIDYSTNWFNNHTRAILSAYGKSPFYEHFAEDFLNIINKKHHFLFDLNLEILSKCLELLEINPGFSFAEKYEKPAISSVFDARELIDPKKPDKKNKFFRPAPYYQVFGKNFVEDLSILDLLFCEGPNAMFIIRQSVLTEERRKTDLY